MTTNSPQTVRAYLLILISIALALVLTFIRIPHHIAWLQPAWLIIIVLYWSLMAPQYINVGTAFFVGFMLDIMYNAPIGENCFALVLVCFLTTKFRHRIIPLGFWKSSLVIFGLALTYQLLKFLMQFFIGEYFNTWIILGGALTSALIWIPLSLLLFRCQTKLRI